MKRLTAAILALGLLAMTGDRALAQGPVSTEKVKIVVGYQPLTPTWGVTILTGAQLWKPYLPNVEVERFNSMSGMPLVLSDERTKRAAGCGVRRYGVGPNSAGEPPKNE